MFTMSIAGNLGKDATFRTVGQNQTSVCNFAVAVKTSRKGQDGKPITQWVDCALWGKRAESLGQYLTKGTKVAISGEPGVEIFNGQNGAIPKMTLNVDQITLLGGGQQAQQPQPNGVPNGAQNGMNMGQAPQQQPAPNGMQMQNGMGQNQQMNNQPQQQAPAYAGGGDFEDDVPFAKAGEGLLV